MPVVRPNAFVAPLGMLGLGSVWRSMADFYGWPGGVADAICLAAALLSVVLGGLALAPLRPLTARSRARRPGGPCAGTFAVIPFMVLMLLGAIGLAPHAKSVADVLFAIGLTGSLLMGGWIAGGWLGGPVDECHAHPAYFLPVLAPGLVGALSAGTLGYRELGWACLGLGLIGWLMMGSVIWHRLMFGPPLPAPLAATRATEIAPPAVASVAYLLLDGDRVDPVVLGLARRVQ